MSTLVRKSGKRVGRNAFRRSVSFVATFAMTASCFGAKGMPVEDGFTSFVSENVHFSARLHPQYEYLESRLEGTDVADPVNYERLFLRRVLAGVKIDLWKQFRVNYLTDVSDYEAKNQVARLEWELSDSDQLFFGYQKAPFGFEDTLSSAKVKPIERSVNTRFWNEVVGIGSYHSGIYYTHDFEKGRSSILGLTHNVKGESDWPDLLDDRSSFYARVSEKGKFSDGRPYHHGLDLAYQPYGDGRDILAASGFCGFSFSKFEYALEATVGRIGLANGETSNAVGWHAQVSRLLAERVEGVVRLSSVDTDGYELKLSSGIRKAPYSGFKYGRVESLYLGLNYLVNGDRLKFSVGYELANGRHALSGVGPLDSVRETVSGFRLRGQLML